MGSCTHAHIFVFRVLRVKRSIRIIYTQANKIDLTSQFLKNYNKALKYAQIYIKT